MRLAVLSDIHGNIEALRAVLDHAKEQAVSHYVVAGDIINILPDSRACWDLIETLACPVLQGNHERYVYDYGTSRAEPIWSTERFKLLSWFREQFSSAELASMRNLPMAYRLPGLLISHSSPWNDYDYIDEHTPVEELRRLFRDTDEPLLIRGHNHMRRERNWDGRKVVTIGALGMPLNKTGKAQYCILEQDKGIWHYRHQQVAYNRHAVLASLDEAYMEIAGPIGRLFKYELLTAKGQLYPFFGQYGEAIETSALSLEEAVDCYLVAQEVV